MISYSQIARFLTPKQRKMLGLIMLVLGAFGIYILDPLAQESTPAPQPSSTTATSTYLVTRIVDGDTIAIDLNGTETLVRYIGIDTPETKHPNKLKECFGKEAFAKNTELVLGKYVRLEQDVSNTDKYDRLLRFVYVDEQFINLELVSQGYARAATFPPNVSKSTVFKNAERESREAVRGLWNTCQ